MPNKKSIFSLISISIAIILGLWLLQNLFPAYDPQYIQPISISYTSTAQNTIKLYRQTPRGKLVEITAGKTYTEDIFRNIIIEKTTPCPAITITIGTKNYTIQDPPSGVLQLPHENGTINYSHTTTNSLANTFPLYIALGLLCLLLFTYYLNNNPYKIKNSWITYSVLGILVFLPIFLSGWYDDDLLLYMYIPGYRALHSMSAFGYVWTDIMHYAQAGRLTPIIQSVYALVFTHYPNIMIYKLSIISMTILCLYVFKELLVSLGRSKAESIFIAIVTLALFQLRFFHDALTSYYAIVQLFILMSLLSWKFLLDFLHTNTKKYLYWSYALYFVSLYTYEIALLFLPLYIMIIVLRNKQNYTQALRIGIPYILCMAFYMLSLFTMKAVIPQAPEYTGIAIQLDIPNMLKTYLFQFTGTFPGISFLGDIRYLTLFKGLPAVYGLITGLIAGYAASMIYPTPQKTKEKNTLVLLFIGLTLLCMPPVLIALSAKYQKSLYLGTGYLFVLIQYFGLAILCYYLMKKLTLSKTTALFLISITFFIHTTNNLTTVIERNRDLYKPFKTLDRAIPQGLLNNIPEHSTLGFSRAFMNAPLYEGYLYDKTKKHYTCAFIDQIDVYPDQYYIVSFERSTEAIRIEKKK